MKIEKMSIYNIQCHSVLEQLMEIAKKTNEIVEQHNKIEDNLPYINFDCVTGNLTIVKNKDKQTTIEDLPYEVLRGCEY